MRIATPTKRSLPGLAVSLALLTKFKSRPVSDVRSSTPCSHLHGNSG
jgi:hypothetical protein